MGLSKANDKHPNWKGDKAKYQAIHSWIRKNKPKSMFCEKCGKITKVEVANISGEYKRDIDDYRWLCHKCHIKGDFKEGYRLRINGQFRKKK